jgi:hypothetical protein
LHILVPPSWCIPIHLKVEKITDRCHHSPINLDNLNSTRMSSRSSIFRFVHSLPYSSPLSIRNQESRTTPQQHCSKDFELVRESFQRQPLICETCSDSNTIWWKPARRDIKSVNSKRRHRRSAHSRVPPEKNLNPVPARLLITQNPKSTCRPTWHQVDDDQLNIDIGS